MNAVTTVLGADVDHGLPMPVAFIENLVLGTPQRKHVHQRLGIALFEDAFAQRWDSEAVSIMRDADTRFQNAPLRADPGDEANWSITAPAAHGEMSPRCRDARGCP